MIRKAAISFASAGLAFVAINNHPPFASSKSLCFSLKRMHASTNYFLDKATSSRFCMVVFGPVLRVCTVEVESGTTWRQGGLCGHKGLTPLKCQGKMEYVMIASGRIQYDYKQTN
jgi:hypothetical protein